jgi:LuxR family glucitol operon transcriptional activator
MSQRVSWVDTSVRTRRRPFFGDGDDTDGPRVISGDVASMFGSPRLGAFLSFNATRLTCFALISAIESDSRNLILALGTDASWPKASIDAARDRFQRDRGVWDGTNFTLLVDYLDFADSYQVLLAHKAMLEDTLRTSLVNVASRLELVIAIRNRVAHTRPMEINDFSTLQDLSEILIGDSPRHWSDLESTMSRLKKDPSFVLGLTIQLPSDPIKQPYHNLPFPDFDETGFHGRKDELKRIKQAIRGAWPVVSILGDGGIGKTSIALKAAYDLLDDESLGYEAVVWVTAKSTTLTTTGIQNISGAIQDSLGLFEAAASELGAPRASAEDAAAEVLQYLAAFKILLVLDNLETVSDQRLRDFLLDLPNGSKVLVTSRIGLGIESPIKLGPLSDEESRRLLKALAAIRNVPLLKSLEDRSIDKFVSRLKGHPLYIKWLVSGVESGKRPSDLFNDNGLLLDFCMSNVFDKLTKRAQGVLQAMQVVQGQLSQGELAFITELSAYEIQETLLELMTTNFVAMRRSGFDEFEGIYQTGEFAGQYLSKNRPIDHQFRSRINAKARELSKLGQTISSRKFASRYDKRSIDTRGPHDIPAARLLVEAQRLLKLGALGPALEACIEAQKLSPTYYEAWRVEGLVQTHRQDRYASSEAYQTAVSLAGESPQVAYHYGNYLLDEVADYSQGLSVLQAAARLDPKSEEVLYSVARAHFLAANYAECLDTCVALLAVAESLSSTQAAVEMLLRAAVFGVETALYDGRLEDGLELIDSVLATARQIGVESIPSGGADWLLRLKFSAARIQTEGESEPYLVKHASSIVDQLSDRVRVIDSTSLDRVVGVIARLNLDKHFAFATVNDRDYFFHHNDLQDRAEWANVEVDRLAAFAIDRGGDRGPRARRVRILS